MSTVPMGRLMSNLGFDTDRTVQRPCTEWSANATQRRALKEQQGAMYVIVCFNCPIGNSSNESVRCWLHSAMACGGCWCGEMA
jgi:hypothetical protein